MTEAEAYDLFCRLRWPDTDGKPVCPKCHCHRFYDIRTRKRFKCRACYTQFSPTTGTVFAYQKAGYLTIMRAMHALLVDGQSALAIEVELDVQYRTAWLLAHRIHASPNLTRAAEIGG
jgi:transposase-like protein